MAQYAARLWLRRFAFCAYASRARVDGNDTRRRFAFVPISAIDVIFSCHPGDHPTGPGMTRAL
jgi:hypothetical protein